MLVQNIEIEEEFINYIIGNKFFSLIFIKHQYEFFSNFGKNMQHQKEGSSLEGLEKMW